MTKRAAVYTRLSDARGENVSLATQEQDCRAKAQALGYDNVTVLAEAGKSASEFRRRERPVWTALLAHLGDYDALIGWKQDRLTRDEYEWHGLARAAGRAGVRIVTVVDGTDIDPDDPELLSPSVKAAVAAEESRNTSKRVSRALQARAERGEPSGGPRGFGYAYANGTLIVVDDEADVIREAARRALSGEQLSSIVADFRERGIPTAKGGQWMRSTLRGVLVSPRIAGLRQHNDDAPVEATWEPIISRAEHDELVAILQPSPVRRAAPRRYMLSGIARCGRCGSSMSGNSWVDADGRVRRAPRYHCASGGDHQSCGGVAIAATPLDEYVEAAVITRLANRTFRRKLDASATDPGIATLHKQARRLDTVADNLAAMVGAGEMSRREFRLARERNDTDRDRLADEIRQRSGAQRGVLVGAPTTEAGLHDFFDSADLQQRHALISAVIESVEVHPAVRGRKAFDADRLVIRWRD